MSWSRHPFKSLEEAFWARVPEGLGADECWEWNGPVSGDGYGVIWRTVEGKRQFNRAHRVSWKLNMGQEPGEMAVCHHCDNPLCVNPDHLFLGTAADNMADMRAKGRGARGEKHGRAKLTEEDVREIRRLGKTQSSPKIAEVFDVSRRHISDILSGKRWAHV